MPTYSKLHTLTIVPVRELTGLFHIPDFQRGYRWQRKHVAQLLEDIKNNPDSQSYFLQPITVVRRANASSGVYDLIDGQQRLTTIFLIYKALQQKADAEESINCGYSICYDTREDSGDFLANVDKKSGEEAAQYPDYLYMWHAYQKITTWLDEQGNEWKTFAHQLAANVKVIWYELDANTYDAWEVFSNLNSGKIGLTNSELVKALFLCSANNKDHDSGLTTYEKTSIVEQWDSIERDLSTPAFWAFLTNRPMSDYATKIDLLLDIIANKPKNDTRELFTFAYFEKEFKGGKVSQANWQHIYDQYLKLRDWYENNALFHKIGYLIAADRKSLQEIYNYGCNVSESELERKVDDWIKNSIRVKEDVTLETLSYSNNKEIIHRVLTLLNIMSMLILDDNNIRYPFNLHHESERDKGGWSLEHIHAQNSQSIKKEGKSKWIELHLKSLERFESLVHGDHLKLHESATEQEKIDIEQSYQNIKNKVANLRKNLQDKQNQADPGELKPLMEEFSDCVKPPFKKTEENLHRDCLSNMALLTKTDNSVLNNSSFDVKRMIVLDDLADEFIPPFTTKVFAKSFRGADMSQLYFWSEIDRVAYLNEIKRMLKPYLDNEELPKK